MAPDGERTSRKKTSHPTAMYSLQPRSQSLPCRDVPEQSRQTVPSGKRTLRKKSSLSSSSAVYSLATTKAVKPKNSIRLSKPNRQSNLQQQQQRQRHQQLQQLRSIRRKRTVAFALNRASQPQQSAGVVSADLESLEYDSSSARSSRASPTIRCTFQQENSDGACQLPRSLPSHQGSNLKSSSLPSRQIGNSDTSLDVDKKKSTHETRKLIVDVRCAETANARNSCDGCCLPNPVPVTPTYLPSCVHGTNDFNSQKMKSLAGKTDNNATSDLKQDQEALASADIAKVSRKTEAKRVRYDMECVPPVEINKDIWKNASLQLPRQSHCTKSYLPGKRENDINDNHITPANTEERSFFNPPVVTISSDSEIDNMKNDLQSSTNLLLKGSVLWVPASRQEWEDCVSEMKAVCTSAAFRRWSRSITNEYEKNIRNYNCVNNSVNNDNSIQEAIAADDIRSSPHQSTTMQSFQPPLSQAFIKDRVAIDDPLRGYQIRHAKGGWLQGFLLWTNFTVWTLDFQWDSNHPSSGLLCNDKESEERSVANDDGTLSKELQALPRGTKDPLDGGIVLDQIAEISLLGALGCGELLLRKAIEDIRISKNKNNFNYKYVVLQATEGSRKFYEKMGFVRVGAVCRYRWAEYCRSKAGTVNAATGKKAALPKMNFKYVDSMSAIDPPTTLHGYRHWTFTNESVKSLDAHGGPSVMMCLKLEDYDERNKQYQNPRTLSNLLQSHTVEKKPTIELFGNVSNPKSENVTPTRKSQRRGSRTLKVMEQEQNQNEEGRSTFNHQSSAVAVGTVGLSTNNPITRRTSNRSKRGQNTFFGNSGFITYGAEGFRNFSNKSNSNTTTSSKSATKRQRRSPMHTRNVSMEELEATKDVTNDVVVTQSVPRKRELGKTIRHKGDSSTIASPKGASEVNDIVSSLSTTSKKPFSCSTLNMEGNEEKCSAETSLTISGHDSNPNTMITVKETAGPSITIPLHREHEEAVNTREAASTRADSFKCALNIACDCPPGRTTVAAMKKEKMPIDDTTSRPIGAGLADHLSFVNKNGAEPTSSEPSQLGANQECLGSAQSGETPTVEEEIPMKNYKNDNVIKESTSSSSIFDQSSSKELEKNAAHARHDEVEKEGANKNPAAPSTCDKSFNRPQQQALVHQSRSKKRQLATTILKKRTRRQPKVINKSKLFKQKVGKKDITDDDFFNRVVVRRDIRCPLNQECKRRRVNSNPKKKKYNGGLMIDHRYEFCYYFVLHYNKSEKTLTMVPMIKDGVFERTKESKNKKMTNPVIDETLLGRPRYLCNILNTDKNWIRDAPQDEYTIVQDAINVFGSPLVGQEEWNILSNSSVPNV